MLGGGIAIGESAGTLEHELHAEVLPGQLLWLFDGGDSDRLAVHDERVALRFDGAGKAPVHRVVFQEVRQRLRVGDVVDADEFDVGLLGRGGRAHHVAADASEPIDPYPHCHVSPLR